MVIYPPNRGNSRGAGIVAEPRFVGRLLIRAAPNQAAAPDAIQVTSGGDPVLVGSSLAGALRIRTRRILRLVGASHDDADRSREELFGSYQAGQPLGPLGKLVGTFVWPLSSGRTPNRLTLPWSSRGSTSCTPLGTDRSPCSIGGALLFGAPTRGESGT